jgi:hypothetical protein
MAGEDLYSALGGLQYSPYETPFGTAAGTIASATPGLINPYGSTGQAIGIALGGTLLSSLLGYQAQKEASQNTLDLMTYANKMQAMPLAQDRIDYIKGIENPMYQGRLASLATALNARETENKLKLQDVIGLETGKLKAIQSFYNTPEGIASREFELRKIEEEAKARRTPLEDLLARQALANQGRMDVANVNVEGKKLIQTQRDEQANRRQQLSLEAKSGSEEKQRQWKTEQNTINQQFDKELAKFKIEAGADAAVNRESRLNDLRMQNMQEGDDYNTALLNARAQITKELQTDMLTLKDEMGRKRMQEYNTAIEQRMYKRKELDQQFPNVTAKMKDSAADASAFSNLAKDLASDIRKISSYPEYRAVKAFSNIGDEQLKSRTLDIADRLVRTRSGMATRGAEDEKLEKIALGDFTAGPQEVANILERLANDTLRVAADKLSAGTQSPSSLAQAMREAASGGNRLNLEPRQYQSGEMETSGDRLGALEQRLKQLQERRKQLEQQKGVR